MAERLPPRAVVALLNEYFTAMSKVVRHYGGELDKYIGDAMMVVWEQEARIGALGAVQAAVSMQAELGRLQEKWLTEGKIPLKCRIGISSGRVIIGLIGSPTRQERTVIGDAVNMAARLESMNKAFHTDVLLSDMTRQLLPDDFALRSLGPVTIKGRREPVVIHALNREETTDGGPITDHES